MGERLLAVNVTPRLPACVRMHVLTHVLARMCLHACACCACPCVLPPYTQQTMTIDSQNCFAEMNVIVEPIETDAIREDRLRRNRLSAQKCRMKRKNRVDQLEAEVNELSAENARLLRENEKLQALISLTPPLSPVSSGSRKRARHEYGVTTSLDFS